ncbi:YraN family protein [Ornithinimicrobium pratense]|nr:YraN family protein [Ornithinimicrobium pratense]
MGGPGMPWARARAVGDRGEDLACAHLEGLGWQVVARNWRCPQGELDVVADEEGLLVFCEVKTRRSTRFGTPLEAVDEQKARRLRRLAWTWLAEHGRSGETFRIDVVGVLCLAGAPAQIQHLQGVA